MIYVLIKIILYAKVIYARLVKSYYILYLQISAKSRRRRSKFWCQVWFVILTLGASAQRLGLSQDAVLSPPP